MSEPAEGVEAVPLARRRASLVSPLRYPGGKRRLAGYVAELLRLNELRPKLYVEPFAGGASVALQLLNDGLVEEIVLGEKDALVAAFWSVVLGDHEWLVQAIRETAPTIENWQRFRSMPLHDKREQALACIFLNRTSYSGILNSSAGPIGGRRQQSSYRIDCRYAAETVIRRIEQIARLAGRVRWVRLADWRDLVGEVEALGYRRDEVFYYFDPPFYAKAERLYRHAFDQADHQQLHDSLGALRANYLLSYDLAQPIVELYARNGIGPAHVELLYSATRPDKLVRAQELIVTNLECLPTSTRLWRSMAEWRRPTGIAVGD